MDQNKVISGGINLYPELYGDDDFVEFDSMIDIRPSQGNQHRGVESLEVRAQIIDIVAKLVSK